MNAATEAAVEALEQIAAWNCEDAPEDAWRMVALANATLMLMGEGVVEPTASEPTTACKRYGCHVNPNHGRCNRCGGGDHVRCVEYGECWTGDNATCPALREYT